MESCTKKRLNTIINLVKKGKAGIVVSQATKSWFCTARNLDGMREDKKKKDLPAFVELNSQEFEWLCTVFKAVSSSQFQTQ